MLNMQQVEFLMKFDKIMEKPPIYENCQFNEYPFLLQP